MSNEAARVLDDALRLSAEERSVLALALLDSVGDEQPDVEDAWREEVRQRLGEARAGKIDVSPWRQARARIFAR
jgi:putative addiction module component (TIGR02574 family)